MKTKLAYIALALSVSALAGTSLESWAHIHCGTLTAFRCCYLAFFAVVSVVYCIRLSAYLAKGGRP